ncbi:MAG: hypothetical protein V1932_08915 [Chloroflexota bacterium]
MPKNVMMLISMAIQSSRIRGGTTQPLGADGISQLIQRLFDRAALKYLGHDLRRTFAHWLRKLAVLKH